MYAQDPAAMRQFDAIIEKFGKRCEELRSKLSTGPLMTSLMDLVQSFFQDIKNGRDPFEEINDDPIYHFTATAMTDLFTPEAGSENAAFKGNVQAVSDYAHMVKEHPGNTEVILHMANLMRTAGSAAQTYLIEKGAGKRSSETGNIRYNNAYAALYLTAPKDATTLSQTAKNLNITAERTRRGEKREHLSLETLMKEEFGNLDRTYKKSANGQGYEKVKPAPEKHGKKK